MNLLAMNKVATTTIEPRVVRGRAHLGSDLDVPNNGFIHLVPKTHDISSIGGHIPDISTLAADLNKAVQAGWPRRHEIRYSKVEALLLSWVDDDLGVKTELNGLQHVFQDLYHYQAQTFEIPSDKPDKALTHRILDFLDQDSEETLYILYYAGHARISVLANGGPVWYANRRTDSASLPSGGIQSKFEEADADVLLLYDCCNSAATTTSTFRGHKGVTEVIAACGYETLAPEVGEHSFSNALTEVLVAASKEAPISVAELHARVLGRLKCWTPSFLKDEDGKFTEDGEGRLKREIQRRRTPIYGTLCETEPRRSICVGPIRVPSSQTQTDPHCGKTSTAVNQPLEILKTASSGKRKMITLEEEDCPQKRRRALENNEPTAQHPQILLAIRLEKDDLDIQAWKECFLHRLPSEAQEIKIEGVYRSFSTLLLLRMPVVIWNLLPSNQAYSFVGFVTSENLETSRSCHPFLSVRHPNEIDLEPSTPVLQDSTSVQKESSGCLSEPDILENSQPELHPRHGDVTAEGMLWFPLKSINIQQNVKGYGSLPFTEVSAIKTHEAFRPQQHGVKFDGPYGMEESAVNVKLWSPKNVWEPNDEGLRATNRGEEFLRSTIHVEHDAMSDDDTYAEGEFDQDVIVTEETSDTEYHPMSTKTRKRTISKATSASSQHFRPKKFSKIKGQFTCNYCDRAPFKDAAALQRHVISFHTRAFICVFAFAGCTCTFASKNEWKRHVSSQHLHLTAWVCDIGACGGSSQSSSGPTKANINRPKMGTEFNRKDLFTQHLRRMHAPAYVKRAQKKNPEWEDRIKELQVSCLRIKREAATKLSCPVTGCETVLFEGESCWDDRMEHVARHLDSGTNSLEVKQENDELLVSWALKEGIIEVRPGGGGYRLCEGSRSRVDDEDAEGEEE